jgi:hypothetical protein
MDQVVAVVADASGDDGRCGGVEGGDRCVARWVDEGKIGRVEEGRRAGRAPAAEYQAALVAVL